MSAILFPNNVVIETKHFKVAQDWEVPIPGFFIISSHRKISSVADFSDEEAQEFTLLLSDIRQGMRDVLHIKEVYLFQNEDSEHDFHLWLFPRYEWMEKFGRKIESVRPIMEYAKNHMITDDMSKQVKHMVKQLKDYIEKKIDTTNTSLPAT